MGNVKVSVWAVGLVGISSVFLLANYVTAQFQEVSAIEDQSVSEGLYIDNPPPPVVASSTELKRIDQWIGKNNLNKYGDLKDTKYKKGEPLVKNGQKVFVNRFHYIIVKHPNRPWNDGTDLDEKKLIDKWITANNLNEFGDLLGTEYSTDDPQYYGSNNQEFDRYAFIEKKHPDRPWASIVNK